VGITYKIEIDGKDITAKMVSERRLLEVEIEDREGAAADQLRLVLDDREPHVQWPPDGARARVWLGTDATGLVDMGAYTLDAPEASSPPDRLLVRGHSANFTLAGSLVPLHTEHTKKWGDTTVKQLAESIAKRHGMIARVQSDVGSIELEGVEQIRESDIIFLSRMVERVGGKVRVKYATSNPAGALEVVTAGPQLDAVTLTKPEVERWSAPLSSRQKIGSVTAFWRSPAKGTRGKKTVGDGEPKITLTQIYRGAKAAAHAAQAKFDAGQRESHKIELALTTLRPDIATGTPITLEGFRSEIDRTWNVVVARHRASGSSGRTSLTAERVG
jgi:phage protein D